MTTVMEKELRALRERTVRTHLDAENRGDIPATKATFHDCNYEIVAMGEFPGEAAVEGMLTMFFTAFPDLHQEIVTLHHSDGAVILEVLNTGTHQGPLGPLPASGRRLALRSCNIMRFDDEHLIGETIYYDAATMMAQLGGS